MKPADTMDVLIQLKSDLDDVWMNTRNCETYEEARRTIEEWPARFTGDELTALLLDGTLTNPGQVDLVFQHPRLPASLMLEMAQACLDTWHGQQRYPWMRGTLDAGFLARCLLANLMAVDDVARVLASIPETGPVIAVNLTFSDEVVCLSVDAVAASGTLSDRSHTLRAVLSRPAVSEALAGKSAKLADVLWDDLEEYEAEVYHRHGRRASESFALARGLLDTSGPFREHLSDELASKMTVAVASS